MCYLSSLHRLHHFPKHMVTSTYSSLNTSRTLINWFHSCAGAANCCYTPFTAEFTEALEGSNFLSLPKQSESGRDWAHPESYCPLFVPAEAIKHWIRSASFGIALGTRKHQSQVRPRKSSTPNTAVQEGPSWGEMPPPITLNSCCM